MRSARSGVVDEHGVEDGAEGDAVGVAPGLGRPRPHGLDRRLEVRGRCAGADEYAVGDAPGGAQHARATRGDPDGHGPGVRQPRRVARAGLDGLAVQQGAGEARRLLQLADARRAQPGQPHGGVADTEPEQRAALGELVDGGDRGGGDADVAVDRVRDQRADADAAGRAGSLGEHHVGVAAAQLRVRDEAVVPAQLLGAAHVGGERRHGAEVEAVQAEGRHRHAARVSEGARSRNKEGFIAEPRGCPRRRR